MVIFPNTVPEKLPIYMPKDGASILLPSIHAPLYMIKMCLCIDLLESTLFIFTAYEGCR